MFLKSVQQKKAQTLFESPKGLLFIYVAPQNAGFYPLLTHTITVYYGGKRFRKPYPHEKKRAKIGGYVDIFIHSSWVEIGALLFYRESIQRFFLCFSQLLDVYALNHFIKHPVPVYFCFEMQED